MAKERLIAACVRGMVVENLDNGTDRRPVRYDMIPQHTE